MVSALLVIGIVLVFAVVLVSLKRSRDQSNLEQHSISVEQLHSLLASNEHVILLDVRQPLDVLAYPELIPGAQRIPPEEVLRKPSLIARDKDIVIYCTCPSDKTSRVVLRGALSLGLSRVKFLRGGLAAWKQKGYRTEPYRESFQNKTPTVIPPR